MLLSYDEQLFQQTNGQIGEKLEQALEEPSLFDENLPIWGAPMYSDTFLLKQERAEKICFQLVKYYWGKFDLFFYDAFSKANMNVDMANEKMGQFFAQPQNRKQLFTFLHTQGEVEFEQLIEFIFAKAIRTPRPQTGLNKIYVYKVNNQFFVQPIYCEHEKFWQVIGAKKIYSVFLQLPLKKISRPVELMATFKALLAEQLTVNRVATIVHKLIQKIDFENPKSDELKQLHLLNVRTHFTSGRRHMLKLRKCIYALQRSWSTGEFALNNKEYTLLGYMLFQEAVFKKDYRNILMQGMYLIEEERLNNHAIELVVEYTDVLSSMNPQPDALVKHYRKNYIEHVFYELIDSVVKEEKFEQGIELLRNYELATCTTIFELLQSTDYEDILHKIEATVQRDIAILVDGSIHKVRESLATWQSEYMDPRSPYNAIALMTSQHICNLLKILFYAEEDNLVEKLLAVYKKYLLVPAHFYNLRQFIEHRVMVTR
ncbi:Fe-S-cluster redox enzyme [Solibacillus sp. A46]|uniref:Fe-S-cluster redox enzyme n=1 Tax=Solibacillus faecavium TaxID=2762221 RepID=A0ABR8Y2Y9_9BACL|nr:Fe-S-cluster redox enzyme [Solibacillus faecavium]